MLPLRRLSVLIPTLNEEEGLPATLEAIPRKRLSREGWRVEVIVIDGNSRDRTREIAAKRGCRVIVEPRRGYGRAYKTGMALATGDLIATGDADGTYPFDRLPEYLKQVEEEGLDFLTTNRFGMIDTGAMGLKHRFGNWVLSTALQLLFLRRIKDSQSGMWIFRRDCLARMQPLEAFHDGMPFSEEIKIEAFLRREIQAREVPAPYYARVGEAKLESWRDGFRNLLFLAWKRFTFRRRNRAGALPASPVGPWREENAA